MCDDKNMTKAYCNGVAAFWRAADKSTVRAACAMATVAARSKLPEWSAGMLDAALMAVTA